MSDTPFITNEEVAAIARRASVAPVDQDALRMDLLRLLVERETIRLALARAVAGKEDPSLSLEQILKHVTNNKQQLEHVFKSLHEAQQEAKRQSALCDDWMKKADDLESRLAEVQGEASGATADPDSVTTAAKAYVEENTERDWTGADGKGIGGKEPGWACLICEAGDNTCKRDCPVRPFRVALGWKLREPAAKKGKR